MCVFVPMLRTVYRRLRYVSNIRSPYSVPAEFHQQRPVSSRSALLRETHSYTATLCLCHRLHGYVCRTHHSSSVRVYVCVYVHVFLVCVSACSMASKPKLTLRLRFIRCLPTVEKGTRSVIGVVVTVTSLNNLQQNAHSLFVSFLFCMWIKKTAFCFCDLCCSTLVSWCGLWNCCRSSARHVINSRLHIICR